MYPSLGFNKVYELEKKIPGCFGEDFKHDDLFSTISSQALGAA